MWEFIVLLMTLAPPATLLVAVGLYVLYRLGLLKVYGLAPNTEYKAKSSNVT